jgi:hypothetical protein
MAADGAPAAARGAGGPAALPELAAVWWRPRMDAARLTRYGRLWTATTVAHVVPFCVAAVVLVLIEPWLFPMAAIGLVEAWVIPELYANRGAKVMRPVRPAGPAAAGRARRAGRARCGCAGEEEGARVARTPAERTAMGLLGDLVGHRARELYARTGVVVEDGGLGTWVVGQAGALLVRGRRVHCFCVGVAEADLPPADRVAHLLLALRADEAGFATVANQAFAGARWRVRRRLSPAVRPALDAACQAERGRPAASSAPPRHPGVAAA